MQQAEMYRSLLLAVIIVGCAGTNESKHRSRYRRQGAGLYLPSSYVLPGGEGTGWGEWGETSPCSRTCGGGVASQKRICVQVGAEGPMCTGGDTKYFSCQTQDCPPEAKDFRAEQCSEFDNEIFKGKKYNWQPYTTVPNPCELNCMPQDERFYYRHKTAVIDGTRCSDDSFDVCVQGVCQPVGCDMMLGSSAKEDKCRVCRGNGTNCNTYSNILDTQDLIQGYNDLLLIPEGSTSIQIAQLKASNNYLALRALNGTFYLNGHYQIHSPRSLTIAGALWHYERSPQGNSDLDKLHCKGPTTEALFLSLLYRDENVGIQYEYSLPKTQTSLLTQNYNWMHDEFTPCSEICGGGYQSGNVTCRSREDLEVVDEALCDAALRPVSQQPCNVEACNLEWAPGPWSACSRRCGPLGNRTRSVLCRNILTNGFSSEVSEKACFDLLGPKPAIFEECNVNASCPAWFSGPWTPCDKQCGEGKQTRQVKCVQEKGGRLHVLDSEECEAEQPPAEQACLEQYCEGVDWVLTDWTGCDSCLSKERTRLAECATRSHVVVEAKYCVQPKPVLHQLCDQASLPRCRPQWYFTYVNNINFVWCGRMDGAWVVVVDENQCADLPKNNNTNDSNESEKSSSRWYAGPWTRCTKECDGGKQHRIVMCLRAGRVETYCEGATVLDSTQLCNTQRCEEDNSQYCDDDGIPHIDETTDDRTVTETILDTATATIKSVWTESDFPDSTETFSTTTEELAKKRICKQRNCTTTYFGCCPDRKNDAKGPFYEGCYLPRTCKETKFGCCPDKVSSALGANDLGCPTVPCNATLFGCCISDNTTAAEGNDQQGCPLPSVNNSSKDLTIDEATGMSTIDNEGCKSSAQGCFDNETILTGPNNQGTLCRGTEFGCCPGEERPAQGPHLEGCGCQYSQHGCCPDNVTVARGPGNEGCGCQYTEHGCCPDRRTEAAGPKYEGCGCETYQFGCCPDGETRAKGPRLQGCHCRQSEHGCCGDGETAARGPHMQGCDCAASQFGCCPDGLTEAEGRKFLGCTDLPENRQATCSLPLDPGPCHNYTMAWFYDMEYGGCSRFWYGGCEGNRNKFFTEEECEDVCVQPPPKDTTS